MTNDRPDSPASNPRAAEEGSGGFGMPARTTIFEPNARERADTARTRRVASDYMNWFVSTDRKSLCCASVASTMLLVLGLTLYTLIITGITQARIERAAAERSRRSALPVPLNLEKCEDRKITMLAFNPAEAGIVVDPDCYDSCDLGIKCVDDQGNPMPKPGIEKPGNTTTEGNIPGIDDETDGDGNYEAYDDNGNLIDSKVVDEDGNISSEMRIIFDDLDSEEKEAEDEDGNKIKTRKLRFCVCARSSGTCACKASKLRVEEESRDGEVLPLRPGHLVDITVGKKEVAIRAN